MKAPKLPRAVVAHFAASGIDEQHLRKLGEFMPAGAIKGVPVDGFRLRYFEPDGSANCFYRDRLLADFVPEGEDKPLRYKQPAGTKPRAYMPPLLPSTWAEIAVDVGVPLIVTEGEKKAACACIRGFATLGLGGVWSWKADGEPIPDLDLFVWRSRSVCIVFDSDAAGNAKVAAARAALAAELKARGAAVRVVDLPHAADGSKNGLDDYLIAQGAQALAGLLADAPEWADPVAELNREIAFVTAGGKGLILSESVDHLERPDFSLFSVYDAGNKFANRLAPKGDKFVPAFGAWLRSPERREFAGIVFDPTNRAGAAFFNMWRGLAVEPQQGDCSLYLDHLREVVCSGGADLFEYVLAWMAHAVQRPGELPGTAIALRGGQGTGKGMALSWFGRLFGRHFVTLTNPRHLTGNFNAHTKDALVIFADEAVWAGDKSAEGTLKAMVTEPTRTVEFKGKDAIQIDNYTRVVAASNHDWVVPAGMDERRWLVIDVSEHRQQDHAYFKALNDQMEAGGLSALLHHLMHLDISTFNLRALPRTTALAETKVHSMNPVQRFWFDCLQRGANHPAGDWRTEVECDKLHELYSERAAAAGSRYRAMQTELGMALKKLVPGVTKRRRSTGTVRQATAARPYVWVFPSLQECRSLMAEAMRCDEADLAWDDEPGTKPEPKRTRSRK
jgi:hypothetical protein